MKKHWKRLKKNAAKQWESFKEHMNAQKFYLYQALDTIKSATTIVLLAAFVMISALSANMFHEQYIESHVGSQSVFIRSPIGAKIQGSATGFEVKAPSGKVYTLTNAHVCELQKDGNVMVFDKRADRLVPKRVIEVWEDNDLCLVEGLTGYSGLSLANDSWIGEKGWSVGYPLGESMNISSGRIKDFSDIQLIDFPKTCEGPRRKKATLDLLFIQLEVCIITRFAANTDIATYPGNSGSPMVNIYGNVIGVIFASNSRTNWGSAVPLVDVKRFLGAY